MLKTKRTKTKAAEKTGPKIETEQIVPSRHFHRHPAFAIGPEKQTVSDWHTAVTVAVTKLEPRVVDTYDCSLYRFGVDNDGQLRLFVERTVTKPRTVVSGWKARQSGSGKTITDYTKVDDAFELIGEGLQLPEGLLREAIESWANAHRANLDGYTLLQLARAYSLLTAARHGCVLGVTDL